MYSKYHIFKNSGLKNFISSCHRIESDPNYQPNITAKELLFLVMDEKGNARHTPRRNALAIQPMDLIPRSPDGNSLGVLYQIMIAKKSYCDDFDFPIWHVDDSVVIFVNKKAGISLHDSTKAKGGDFTSPVTHWSIDDFLNSPCLHYTEINNNKISNF